MIGQAKNEYTVFTEIPRILQFPNQRACKQNCAKSDSCGAPLMDREFLCSVGEEFISVSTAAKKNEIYLSNNSDR